MNLLLFCVMAPLAAFGALCLYDLIGTMWIVTRSAEAKRDSRVLVLGGIAYGLCHGDKSEAATVLHMTAEALPQRGDAVEALRPPAELVGVPGTGAFTAEAATAYLLVFARIDTRELVATGIYPDRWAGGFGGATMVGEILLLAAIEHASTFEQAAALLHPVAGLCRLPVRGWAPKA